jgi:hypothetical protein
MIFYHFSISTTYINLRDSILFGRWRKQSTDHARYYLKLKPLKGCITATKMKMTLPQFSVTCLMLGTIFRFTAVKQTYDWLIIFVSGNGHYLAPAFNIVLQCFGICEDDYCSDGGDEESVKLVIHNLWCFLFIPARLLVTPFWNVAFCFFMLLEAM